ncbi:MAG: autotransporter assembly complex protein TamA [Acidobacteriota bacterium]
MKRLVAMALVMLLCLPVAALARNGKAQGAARGVVYHVVIEGVEDGQLLNLLRSVSVCVERSGQPAPSAFHLRARAKGDVSRLQDALKSQGRFTSQVAFVVDETVSPAMVRFTVSDAEPFFLRTTVVELAEGAAPLEFPLPTGPELGLVEGSPALSKVIVAGRANLLNILLNKGHPFPVLVDQRVLANVETHGVQVIYTVNPGPRADFGPVRFSGLKDVEESFLQPLVPWKEGDQYKKEHVETFQQRLLDLGLFATVTVAPQEALDDKGRVVVAAAVTERKKRTIKLGVNYKSDEGPGGNIFWEHRNLFGQAEKLRVSLEGSQINQKIEVTFEKPNFLSPKQKFLAGFKASAEDTDAYKGQNALLQAGINRAFTEHLSGTAGLGYRASRIEEDAANPQENSKRWGLVLIPLELAWNNRNDPLDATEGFLLGAKLAPYLDTLGNNLSFLKAELGAIAYLKLVSKPLVVFAVRAGLGSITGAQSKDIPPDVRFYAGGSSTVRGYAYQTVGPLRGDKPLGGNSIFNFGSELRFQVTDLIGLVAFLDGGNVFDKQYPALEEGLLYGAGLGVRVKTPVGPLRVDAALPLNRRPNVDETIQFYISLGQAF